MVPKIKEPTKDTIMVSLHIVYIFIPDINADLGADYLWNKYIKASLKLYTTEIFCLNDVKSYFYAD